MLLTTLHPFRSDFPPHTVYDSSSSTDNLETCRCIHSTKALHMHHVLLFGFDCSYSPPLNTISLLQTFKLVEPTETRLIFLALCSSVYPHYNDFAIRKVCHCCLNMILVILSLFCCDSMYNSLTCTGFVYCEKNLNNFLQTGSSVKLFYSRLQWQASCKQERTVKVYHNLICPTTRHLISPVSSSTEY